MRLLISLTAFLWLFLPPNVRAASDDRGEVALSEDDFKKLDTFEGVLLAKADKVFAAQEYRRAAAEYDAFILQYPKSGAVPYALLRKGRALHRDNKRYDAIKAYGEVLDYFPNAIDYAGGALFYTGECRWENGEAVEAMKAWAEMAQDEDYRKHFLAAGAINRLADNLVRQDKWPEAVAYYEQVAVDFRRANRDAVRHALNQCILAYLRVIPDEAKLRQLYDKAESFEDSPQKGDDGNYWWRVMEAIERHRNFNEADKANRDRYYEYWARTMEGKHPTWDDFQINVARYRLLHENDVGKWVARLDQQFAKHQKPDDYGRVVKWIGAYVGRKDKIDEYYAKLDFAKMTNRQIYELIELLYERNIDVGLARNAIGKLRANETNDDERERAARRVWGRDEEGVRLLCTAMQDGDRGKMTLVRFYRDIRQADKGLALVDELTKVPMYAKEAHWSKGEFHQMKRQWSEAVAAFKLSDSPPGSVFRIAECLLADGKRDQAIAQLREIENFFPNDASNAGLRIAYAYRDTGDQKQQIAALRAVLKKYPTSRESSTAHEDLERMGIKTGGGVDAD